MSCSPFNLKDYLLEELAESQHRQVEQHVRGCDGCRQELQRLRLTQTSLLALREEEIPQRIAFVSDKVYEPSRLRRWWQALWISPARLGFVSAAMLSVAILGAALIRPAPVAAPAAQPDLARLEDAFVQRLHVAVRQAVAESEARQQQRTEDLVKAAERRYEFEQKAMLLTMQQNLEVLQKRFNSIIVASNDIGARQ